MNIFILLVGLSIYINIFAHQMLNIIDGDIGVKIYLQQKPRKVVLKILWMKINMHETAKVN